MILLPLIKRLFRALLNWVVLMALMLSAWGWNRISGFREELPRVFLPLVWLWLESRIRDEEKLLLQEFGQTYASYRQKTTKFVPLVC